MASLAGLLAFLIGRGPVVVLWCAILWVPARFVWKKWSPVEVQPTDPAATGSLDQAPVQVGITTKVVNSVLSVPVTALVGKSGGGFAVEIVRDGGRRELVAVKVGLFDTAGGRVEVEGDLGEGDQVVVPSL